MYQLIKLFNSIKLRSLFILGVILISALYCHAQLNPNINIVKKLNSYAKAKPSNSLFVHTDKTLYTNNETIWFSAYLIKSESVKLTEHTVLSIALISESNRKVVIDASYMMEFGLSNGNLVLPDSIPPGDYQFIASTNVQDLNGKPIVLYTQPITIKSTIEKDFSASLTLLDTAATVSGVRVKVTFNAKYPNKNNKPVIEYNLNNPSAKPTLLPENNNVITIPANLLQQEKPLLTTAVKYGGQTLYLSTLLPQLRSQQLNVKFFPEGGSLVNGLESVVGWEAKTSYNLPISVNGILFENGNPIDTISTTSYGLGKFKLVPKNNRSYSLKIASNSFLKKDTIYNLPNALQDGVVLQLSNAVINDTLRISISSSKEQNLRVFIHNYKQDFASFNLLVKPAMAKIAIPMPTIVKGLATITILDEQERPLAERIFFARYNESIITTINSDKETYGKKEKVTLKLKFNDQTGLPAQGVVSLAVVQDNRIEASKSRDILTYGYLNSDLGHLPLDPSGNNFGNKAYLEDIFLIKTWRNYSWQAMMNSSLSDSVPQTKILPISAWVKYNNKVLESPVTFSILRDSLTSLVTTNSEGKVILNPEQLVVSEGRKLLLSINKKQNLGYTISIDDPGKKAIIGLAQNVEIPERSIANANQSSNDQMVKGLEKNIMLQTVVVNASSDKSLYKSTILPQQNRCGDFVCPAGILNCRNHIGDYRNVAPVIGKKYIDGTSRNPIIYNNCLPEPPNARISRLNGIYKSREFYGVETGPEALNELQYLSTLFWKPGIISSSKGEAEFSFYTGNISGNFNIVVQGIGKKDLIYGRASFMVK